MLARLFLYSLFALTLGCGSDHHVSPWPKDFSLTSLMVPTSIEEHLERIEQQMAAEGLELQQEVEGTFEDGEPFRIRSYRGMDSVGNPKHAIRVATAFGVVMALGPAFSKEQSVHPTVEFLPTFGDGQWRSGTDVNADGLPDIAVLHSTGVIELWGLHAKGASPYPVEAAAPMTKAVDIDEDGRPDLLGVVPVPSHDALSPHLVEVVTFVSGTYAVDAPSVQRWHQSQFSQKGGDSAKEAIERAWHALRAGRSPKATMEALEKETESLGKDLPDSGKAPILRWKNWLRGIAKKIAEKS